MEANMQFRLFLIGLLFAKYSANITNTSNESTICPQHKPFYTKFGCIFECPANFYINGKTCVETCGDMFTLPNRTCESRCPDGFYVKKELRKFGCETYLDKQCVNTCGNNLYINGSMCVQTCGDWFISSDRKCQPFCPINFFIREDIELNDCKTELQKRCLEKCGSNHYAFNGTCLNACPVNLKYINQGHCDQTCSDEHHFIRNFSIRGVLYHECLTSCHRYMYMDNNYCVNVCPNDKFYFERSCLSKCPETHSYMNHNNCDTSCRGLSVNKRCVYTCPKEMPLVFNETCVKECPSVAPRIDLKHLSQLFRVMNVCVSVCDNDEYTYNNKCVKHCPEGKVLHNKNCLHDCPITAPYKCNTSCLENLLQQTTFTTSDELLCLKICPENMFVANASSCVSECHFVSYKHKCFNSCPNNAPYINNQTVGHSCKGINRCNRNTWILECVERCPSDKFLLLNNNTCVEICPPQMFIFNDICTKSCSGDLPYSENVSLTFVKPEFRCIGLPYWMVYEESRFSKTAMHCVQKCKDGYALSNSTCIDVCPGTNEFSLISQQARQYYFYNNTCVETCPESHVFLANSSWNESCSQGTNECYNMKWFLECMSNCPKSTYLYNNRCVDFCPFPLFAFGNMCVPSCPNMSNITVKQELKILRWRHAYVNFYRSYVINLENSKCVSSCEKLLYFNGTCVDACPLTFQYILEGKCVENCPRNFVIDKSENGIYCLPRCPKRYIVGENQTCVTQCPKNILFILDNKCVEHCPKHMYLKTSDEGTYCLQHCPNDNFVGDNRTCVSKCPMHLKYQFNSVCTGECPPLKPFGINTKQYVSDDDIFECIDKCEEDYLFKKDTEQCIHYLNCDYPLFAFNGQCIARCPLHYGWFLSCFSTYAVFWSIPALSIPLLVYAYMCHVLIKDLWTFLRTLLFPVNNHDTDDVSKTCVFRMLANDGYINNAFEAEADI